ncbi:MAG: LigC protein [Planctomycetota bacterium]|nr:LigC protein [Planctomycetota bacterium]
MWKLFSMKRASQAAPTSSREAARTRRRAATRLRAGVEPLEGRSLLTTVTVHVLDIAFNPNAVSIHTGDTVHWVFDGGTHSTTAVGGIAETWDSGVHTPGFTFDHTFTNIGTFPYYCSIHGFDNGNGTAGGMSGSVAVTAAPALQSIAVTPANPSLSIGTTQQFIATGTLADNSTQDLTNQVTWASATPAVATISKTGAATGVAVGTSSISASLNGITGSTSVTVKATTLQSIAITPANPGVVQGQTEKFTAIGTFSDNSTQDLSSQVTWTSSAPSVAAISPSGVASAAGVGSATITATLSGLSASTALTVTAPVTIPPNPLFVATGVKLKVKAHRNLNKAVANFRDPHTTAAEFHAMIDWGDGSTMTDGRIRRTGNGRYSVTGSHVYSAPGSFHAHVMIVDPQGRQVDAMDPVQVLK